MKWKLHLSNPFPEISIQLPYTKVGLGCAVSGQLSNKRKLLANSDHHTSDSGHEGGQRPMKCSSFSRLSKVYSLPFTVLKISSLCN